MTFDYEALERRDERRFADENGLPVAVYKPVFHDGERVSVSSLGLLPQIQGHLTLVEGQSAEFCVGNKNYKEGMPRSEFEDTHHVSNVRHTLLAYDLRTPAGKFAGVEGYRFTRGDIVRFSEGEEWGEPFIFDEEDDFADYSTASVEDLNRVEGRVLHNRLFHAFVAGGQYPEAARIGLDTSILTEFPATGTEAANLEVGTNVDMYERREGSPLFLPQTTQPIQELHKADQQLAGVASSAAGISEYEPQILRHAREIIAADEEIYKVLFTLSQD